MLWYSLEVPHRDASSDDYKQHIFCGEIKKKYYADTPSYLKLCRIMRKTHLGLAKAGLNSLIFEWSL